MPIGSKGLRQMLDTPGARSFGLGVGAAVLGYLLWPVARQAVRPLLKGAVKGALVVGDRLQEFVARAREEMEDVVAEAQFERVREGLAPQSAAGGALAPELPAPESPSPDGSQPA